MRTEIYLIKWGFESCYDSGDELEAIYSDSAKAEEHLAEIVKDRNLEERVNRKTGEKTGRWTDGDYYTYISRAFMDTKDLYGGTDD